MALNKKINELNEMFSVFDNPMDKYSQIIELGKNNPGLLNEDKNNKNKISGCSSLAWVITTKKNNNFYISIDSDTFIVKGLLNILKIIIDGQTEKDILKLDIQNILNTIGLKNALTSQRTNGFSSALNKIKKQIIDINGR